MTKILAQITVCTTTKQLHQIMYDNLKWYNRCPVLDWYARRQRKLIKERELISN